MIGVETKIFLLQQQIKNWLPDDGILVNCDITIFFSGSRCMTNLEMNDGIIYMDDYIGFYLFCVYYHIKYYRGIIQFYSLQWAYLFKLHGHDLMQFH